MVFGLFRKQFIEVIECPNQDDSTLAWKFPVADNEIKNGAQLTVREGQCAVFLNEGEMGDVFRPGRHQLTTQNLPILTSLKSWKYGFESPFKADVVFLSSREHRGCKWGTPQPIVLRDPDFGMVRVRAFGTYGLRIISPQDFIKECAGVRDFYDRAEIENVIRSVVISRFTDALVELKVGAIDMATKYQQLGEVVTKKIARSFDSYGIEITNFTIESVNMPEEIQKVIDKSSEMNLMMGQGQKYAQWQVLQAVPEAMKGGTLGGMASNMAMGAIMGQAVQNGLQGVQQTPAAATPAPASGAGAAGRDPNAKFCSECGSKVARAAKFCPECGHRFEGV